MHKLVHKLHDLVVYEKRGVYVMDFLRSKLIEGPLWHAKMSLLSWVHSLTSSQV